MKIGYGLIGLGGIARTHLQALKSLPVLETPVPFPDLAALFTTDPNKIEQGKRIGFTHVVHDLEQFLELPGVDIVDICTPNYLHYPQILAAAKHGKHIYYEKPLCLNKKEALKLGQELESYAGMIQGAYVLRFVPAMAIARAFLKSNVIGRVHSFRFTSYHSSYLSPDRPGAWRLKHSASGGGVLMDLGSHMLDLVRFLLGEAVSVSAWTKTVVKSRRWPDGEEAVDVDDHALVVLNLENGSRGTVEVSRVAVGSDGMSVEIFGEKGAIHVDPAQNTCRCFDAWGQEIFPDLEEDSYLTNLLTVFPPAKLSLGWMVDVHLASLAWFLRSVASGEVLDGTPDLKEGILTQQLVDEAYSSAK